MSTVGVRQEKVDSLPPAEMGKLDRKQGMDLHRTVHGIDHGYTTANGPQSNRT